MYNQIRTFSVIDHVDRKSILVQVLLGILIWFAAGTSNNDLAEVVGFNKVYSGVFIALIFLLFIYLICGVVFGFCMNQSICNVKYLSKIPFLYCGFWLFLIFMAVGISLLLV